jgi:peptide deformylase
MPLQIVHYSNPILRKKGAKIAVFDAALARFAEEMIDTMHLAEGIGLAAQQVGRAIQLCVVDVRAGEWDYAWELDGAKPPRDIFMPFVVVNPQITPVPGTQSVLFEEGCLSFPGIRGDVARPDAIIAVYQDQFGTSRTLRCTGMLARCIQHEVDHLNGTLFIDRMEKKARQAVEPAVRELAKQTREEAAAAS